MEQFKCGEIYRDMDGKLSYACLSCPIDFLSSIEFEEHIIIHYVDPKYNVSELSQENSSLIKIESLLADDDYADEEQEQGEEEVEEYEGEEYEGEIEVLEEYEPEFDRIVKCHCCDQFYPCQGLKEQHLRKEEDPDKNCGICPAYFEKNNELAAHRKIHNLAEPITCNHCLEVFATQKKLQCHLTQQKTTPKKRKRDEDVPIDENDKNKAKYSCDLCSKEYTYLHYLKQHLKRHSDNTLNHACDVCGHEFKLRQNLLAHMRIHTGEKPFTCKLCGKSFNQPYYMTVHMRIHQKEKPYQCSLCGVSFVTSSHLGRHMKSHNNIKPHKCSICDKAFILPGHLNDHVRSQHTGERPFSCEVCGNTFSRRKLLRQHMQLHGEKRFKCKYCDLAFAQSAGRRGHEIRVHNAS